MAQIIVRNLDEDLKALLKLRAEQDGVSMEEEVRQIIRRALKPKLSEQPGLGSRIAELFRDWGVDEDELERLPGSEIKPMKFD